MFRLKAKEEQINSSNDKLIKQLKKENRHYEGLLLLGVLQVSALVLCYYLGKSKK